MKIKDVAAAMGVKSVQAVYKRCANHGVNIKAYTDKAGTLSAEGEKLVLAACGLAGDPVKQTEAATVDTPIDTPVDTSAAQDHKQNDEFDRLNLQVDKLNLQNEKLTAQVENLNAQVESLTSERDYLRQALERSQSLEAMAINKIQKPVALPDSVSSGTRPAETPTECPVKHSEHKAVESLKAFLDKLKKGLKRNK